MPDAPVYSLYGVSPTAAQRRLRPIHAHICVVRAIRRRSHKGGFPPAPPPNLNVGALPLALALTLSQVLHDALVITAAQHCTDAELPPLVRVRVRVRVRVGARVRVRARAITLTLTLSLPLPLTRTLTRTLTLTLASSTSCVRCCGASAPSCAS